MQGEKGKENGFRSKFVLGALIAVGICVSVLVGILISTGVKQNKYVSAIERGNHYYTSGDYANAIVEYQKAIEIDEKKDTAYLNLSSVYVLVGDYDNAKATVDRGLQMAVSNRLRDKQSEIDTLIVNMYAEQNEPVSKEEMKAYAKEVTIENSYLDMVAEYSYTEYFRDYGSVTAMKEGQGISLSYPTEGFTATYYNLDKERVLDEKTGLPYAYAKPCEISFANLRSIFSSGADKFVVSYEKLQEIFGSSLKFHKDEAVDRFYISAEYKQCKVYFETDSEGNIISDKAWNKIEPLARGKFEEEEGIEGEVKGYVKDATTGKGIKTSMKIRERGKKTGTLIAELNSKQDGSYIYGGKQGSYTVEVSAKGYITEYFDVEIIRGQVKTGKNIVLSPEVGEGEIRIVLTWGSRPRDLDSYAIGKSSTGQNFNINFTKQSISNIGNLDVDDTSSYGPETITITDIGASFTYSVADFRAEGTLGSSEAKVKVYLPGEKSAQEFKVPSGEGVLWHVFKYENGEVTKINNLTSEVSSKFHIGGR